MQTVDIVIVGSGISAMASALQIQAWSPHTSFVLLEQYQKKWVGGRASNDTFYGVEVVTGAGIGRGRKDHLLHQLIKRFHLPSKNFAIEPHYAQTFEPVDILAILQQLRRAYREQRQKKGAGFHHQTFRAFARPILGPKLYQRFLLSAGYTDYEQEDAYDTLYDYGMEDNTCCWTAFTVPWKRLTHAMMARIGAKHFHFGAKVTAVEQQQDGTITVLVNDQPAYRCQKLIVATTIVSLRKLLGQRYPIYNQIEGQPFLRLYGKFAKSAVPVLKQYVPTFTFVPGPLQRLLPMDADKGVYMIAYCDNANALALEPFLKNTASNRQLFCELLGRSLGLTKEEQQALKLLAIKDFYWKTGTHYYKPLPANSPYASRAAFVRAAQHPAPNILVVGEVVSRNQGWTEGALESVRDGLTRDWLTA